MFLLALGAAILVWLYDVTVVNPNDTSTISGIPVSFANEDVIRSQDLMVTGGSSDTVSLRISGRRSELKKLSKNNIEVTVDLSQITEEGNHDLPYTVQFPANVSSGELSIDNRSPATVSVTVEHYIRRTIEVRTVFEGDVSPGAEGESLVIDTDTMKVTPGEVTVTGPAEQVEAIDCAMITIDRSGISETTVAEYDYELLDASGDPVNRDELVADVEKFTINIPVLKFKEVPLTVRTVDGGGATAANVSYSLSADSIKISGDPSLVDRIHQIELGTLDFASVIGPTTRTYSVSLPEGVNNASGVTEVELTAEVSGLNVINLTIDDFTLINVPENLTAESLGESVQLTLRGTPAALSNLKPEDVAVTVDLSSFTQPGTFIVPVTVKLPDGLQVGPIGSNTLTVTLS
jgi:YbbR domain-containing protein